MKTRVEEKGLVDFRMNYKQLSQELIRLNELYWAIQEKSDKKEKQMRPTVPPFQDYVSKQVQLQREKDENRDSARSDKSNSLSKALSLKSNISNASRDSVKNEQRPKTKNFQ